LFEKLEEVEQKVKDRTSELEEEKAETNALLTAIGEGVIATDINTNVIFINPSAEEILGWKSEEVMGKKIYDFLKMTDEKGDFMPENERPFYLALKIGQKVESSVQKTYYYTRRSGVKFPVSISVTPVKMNGKIIGAIDIFRDIIHEKETDRAKTEFVSLASHQLRTPLSSINWFTEMLLAGDAGKLTKSQKEYLGEIQESNRRMVELISSFLNVSRIDLGTFPSVLEPCDVKEISKSVLLELSSVIKEKKMKVEEEYDKKVEKINTDSKIIRIVFQNLLSNAIKYSPENCKISVSTEKQDDDVLITVKDTGYGIPKKDQSKIFGKLFRAENIKGKETDGNGLGLYIVKSILEQIGGKIWFISEENKGTAFYVTIPILGKKHTA